jgi:DNA-binding transcriptional ArsR family regulator
MKVRRRASFVAALDTRRTMHNHRVVDSLSTTFTALADPIRRAILERLARGEASVGELAAPFAVSQQAISKHLAYLERAQLLAKRREGRQHFCALHPAAFSDVVNWLTKTRAFWNDSFDRLEALALQVQEEEARHGRKRKARRDRAEDRRS